MMPEAIKRLIDFLKHLPGIGPRHATRLGFHFAHLEKSELAQFQTALTAVGQLKLCKDCFLPHSSSGALCSICENSERDQHLIAIVEKETDLLSLEQSKNFTGRYLILGELRKDGVLESGTKVRLNTLRSRFKTSKAKEIILALSPTTYGDLNAMLLEKELKDIAEKITRLGRGIPTGGEIEFADEQTLSDSLKHRS